MSTQFTPGPWVCRIETKVKRGVLNPRIYSIDTGEHLATVEYQFPDISKIELTEVEEAEANARLIAAAPELLEVLQEFIELEEDFEMPGFLRTFMRKAKAAISKAKGEKEGETT